MAAKITADMVKALREQTGAGMMECKKALQETDGNMEQAIEAIAKAGHRKADKKADRTAAEGMIACVISQNGQHAVMLEVTSEKEFVARDENFTTFCEKITNLALEKEVKTVEELKALALDGQTVEEARKALIAKLGENINIRRIEAIAAPGGIIGNYVHNNKIGVLVALEGGEEALAKDIAMHVAAIRPVCIGRDEVSPEMIERETRIAKERALESGKPEAIVEKIVQGQVQKFINEVCLLGQPFVKDANETVEKVLKAHNAVVKSFARFEVGEGIEVKKVSFQEEVMSTARGK